MVFGFIRFTCCLCFRFCLISCVSFGFGFDLWYCLCFLLLELCSGWFWLLLVLLVYLLGWVIVVWVVWCLWVVWEVVVFDYCLCLCVDLCLLVVDICRRLIGFAVILLVVWLWVWRVTIAVWVVVSLVFFVLLACLNCLLWVFRLFVVLNIVCLQWRLIDAYVV